MSSVPAGCSCSVPYGVYHLEMDAVSAFDSHRQTALSQTYTPELNARATHFLCCIKMRISSEFTTKLSAEGGGLDDGCEETPIEPVLDECGQSLEGGVIHPSNALVPADVRTSRFNAGPVQGRYRVAPTQENQRSVQRTTKSHSCCRWGWGGWLGGNVVENSSAGT